ncbi:MAG TPA: c-type cytochrome, partial [Paracoccaceae bacterium]|nr:c-type cytochrome [Paracoccaceae bacterium]
MSYFKGALLGSGAALVLLGATTGWAQPAPGGFDEQVRQGRTVYAANCAACHGEALTGGQFAGTLTGADFLSRWGDVPVGQLETYIRTSMPPGGAGRLPAEAYLALTALVAHENGLALDTPVVRDLAAAMPPAPPVVPDSALRIGGISPNYPFPAAPAQVDRFANYTPLTPAQLANPEPENWLSWRRGHNGQGFSPLDQITTENVARLNVAWAQALPAGPNINEPLVRDGVLYVYGFGDEVFAFDAANG